MSEKSAWSPAQYGRFKEERSQPFFDLLALVRPIPGGRAIDLGCGTGELTRVMHEKTGAAKTIGLDSSETMLAQSAAFAGDGLEFFQGDIAAFGEPESFDLVFSNAAIQWVPGHRELFGRLAALLKPGGQLAIQMPANHDHVSHLVAHEVAGEEPFQTLLGGYIRDVPVEEPGFYASLLFELGFSEPSVGLHIYPHVLAGPGEVVEWVKGSLLTDYERRLQPDEFAAYLERYRAALMPRLAADAGEPYFYGFKRVLLWGRR
jgi:trans-aconitate 2-methyltransferase